jgi:hypothetical protein
MTRPCRPSDNCRRDVTRATTAPIPPPANRPASPTNLPATPIDHQKCLPSPFPRSSWPAAPLALATTCTCASTGSPTPTRHRVSRTSRTASLLAEAALHTRLQWLATEVMVITHTGILRRLTPIRIQRAQRGEKRGRQQQGPGLRVLQGQHFRPAKRGEGGSVQQ